MNEDHKLPIYLQVANHLTQQIAIGQYPIGSNLPKEVELSAAYGISRNTTREALRLLRDAGLVSRRKRAGTAVVASEPISVYQQPINSIKDLLQYAEDTQVVVRRKGRVRCGPALAKMLGCEKGQEWLRVELTRTSPNKAIPICISTTYLNLELPRIEEKVGSVTGPISAMLESVYGLRISAIDQVIDAVRLGTRDARLLKADRGEAALRTIRRYHDETRRMIELSIAIHPRERFSYVTRLERK